jgi:hypothetical protein
MCFGPELFFLGFVGIHPMKLACASDGISSPREICMSASLSGISLRLYPPRIFRLVGCFLVFRLFWPRVVKSYGGTVESTALGWGEETKLDGDRERFEQYLRAMRLDVAKRRSSTASLD